MQFLFLTDVVFVFKDGEFYLVKWRGYLESENTWEPKRNLKCPKLMKQFHSDLDQELRRSKRRGTPKKLDKEVASVLTQKAKLRRSLQRWEAHLNQTCNHPGRIYVVNEVDLEGPPKNFMYINNYKVGQGIVLDEMAVGCECKNCLKEPINGCCPGASLHRMAYNDKGQVRIRPGKPIYECNSQCSCGPDCPNRVVQKGIQFDLCIFKTENGRGWGVRTLQRIKKNTFVMEYVGEVNWAETPVFIVSQVSLHCHCCHRITQTNWEAWSDLVSICAPDHHDRWSREEGSCVRPPRLHIPVWPGLCGGRLYCRCSPPRKHLSLCQPQRKWVTILQYRIYSRHLGLRDKSLSAGAFTEFVSRH